MHLPLTPLHILGKTLGILAKIHTAKKVLVHACRPTASKNLDTPDQLDPKSRPAHVLTYYIYMSLAFPPIANALISV